MRTCQNWLEICWLVALSACLSGLGCRPAPAPAEPGASQSKGKQTVRPQQIIAQGQLQPAGGLIRLSGTPGDTVDQVLISVGQEVQKGQVLIVMRSAATRQAQLDTLQTQLDDARLQHEANIEKARLELSASQLQLDQADQQLASVATRRPGLELLKQQWRDGQASLARIEALAADSLTKAMVSRLEIDKQRATVTAAQLQYQSQSEALEQADTLAKNGKKLAEEKLQAAQKSLELAQRIDPTAVLEAQIAVARQQLALSRIVSPINGTVVSSDARVGENVAQFPLVQVADLSEMICQVEIYQTDAPWVKLGQDALLRNDAFEKPLHGTVSRIDRLVGSPQLRATDPLAKTDYRTLPVQVKIDAADAGVAARWLQLQVEVTITLPGARSEPGW